MKHLNFTAWALITWITPAFIAGVLGWRGIWGTGSAFGDYLIPVPVAGGALHVPTFIAAILAVRLYPGLSENAASLLRAACIGAAATGFALLINIERLYLGLTTDFSSHGIPWEKNAFGLFLLTDSVWALVWMFTRPAFVTRLGPVMAITLGMPSLYVITAISGNKRLEEPFMHGITRPLPNRGDAIRYVYTRMSITDPAFRLKAREFVSDSLPEENVNVEDLAIYFTDSLDVARNHADGDVLKTLCLYEDGTPDRWAKGEADCFSEHVSFMERYSEMARKMPLKIPADVKNYVIARALCPDVEIPERHYGGVAAVNHCYRVNLDDMSNALRQKYSADELREFLPDGPW